MTKLFLVRHGQTDFSRDKKYCGSRDVGLNAEGRRQAEEIGRSFKGVHVDAVYSSDLKRAVQTAEIAFRDLAVGKEKCFREMDFGKLEGLRYEEAAKNYSPLYEAWVRSPLKITLPEGEAFQDFCDRVMTGLASLLMHNADKSIVLVSHGGPIRVILCAAMQRGIENFWSIRQDNGALNVIEYERGKPPIVAAINATEHLHP